MCFLVPSPLGEHLERLEGFCLQADLPRSFCKGRQLAGHDRMLAAGLEPHHSPSLEYLLSLELFELEAVGIVPVEIFDVDFEQSTEYFPGYFTSWLSFCKKL